MKNLLAVVCLLAAVSSVLARDCYSCKYTKGSNADADAEIANIGGLDQGDAECKDPSKSGSEAANKTCTTGTGKTAFCFHEEIILTLNKDSDNTTTTFNFTLYERGCASVDDSKDIDTGDCKDDGDYAITASSFTATGYTTETYKYSGSGRCFCNDKDLCIEDTGSSGDDEDGASAVALSTLAVLAAAILKFVH